MHSFTHWLTGSQYCTRLSTLFIDVNIVLKTDGSITHDWWPLIASWQYAWSTGLYCYLGILIYLTCLLDFGRLSYFKFKINFGFFWFLVGYITSSFTHFIMFFWCLRYKTDFSEAKASKGMHQFCIEKSPDRHFSIHPCWKKFHWRILILQYFVHFESVWSVVNQRKK